MDIVTIAGLIIEVGWPMAKKLIDLWSNKGSVTREEWAAISKMLNESHTQHIAEAEAANP